MSGNCPPPHPRELYPNLPTINCIGKCHQYCVGVQLSTAESDEIRKRKGFTFKGTPEGVRCPLLDVITKRCTVYDIRPMICRLWGLTERMACPHGCKPEWVLTDLEEYHLINEAMYTGGSYTREMYEENREWMADPEFFAYVQKAMRRDDGMTFDRAREHINALKRARGLECPTK